MLHPYGLLIKHFKEKSVASAIPPLGHMKLVAQEGLEPSCSCEQRIFIPPYVTIGIIIDVAVWIMSLPYLAT